MDNTTTKPVVCELKPYTKKELRLLYGVPINTWKTWLKAVPETASTGRKNWLTLIEVEALFRTYGVPGAKVIDFPTPIKSNAA